jgi:hypothetical protein
MSGHGGNGSGGHQSPSFHSRVRIVALASLRGGRCCCNNYWWAFLVPILVVQHLAKRYAAHPVGALAANCRMRVKLAEHREPVPFGYDLRSPRRLRSLPPATRQRRGRMLPSIGRQQRWDSYQI